MTVNLSSDAEEGLERLAIQEGRSVSQIIDEVLRQFVLSAAVTDVDASDVAGTQMRLITELTDISGRF